MQTTRPSRRLFMLCCAAIVLVATAIAIPAPTHAAGTALVRIFNQSTLPVDVQIGSTWVFRNIQPGAISLYRNVASGTRRVTPDQPAAGDYPVPEDVTFVAGSRYTLVVFGGAPASCGGSGETCIWQDPPAAPSIPPAGFATVRLVNQGVELVSIGGDAVLIPDGPGPRSVQLPAGQHYSFCLRDLFAGKEDCLPSVTLASRGRYTVWAVGAPGGVRAVMHSD